MTKLGAALASAPAPSSEPTKAGRILAALARSRVREPIVIPGLGLPAEMTLVGAERLLEIEGEVAAVMNKRGMGDQLSFAGAWELARATRTLADAIIDPDVKDAAAPFGSLTEWGALSREQIQELWRTYAELSEKHDPSIATLTDEDMELIRIAVVKKNATALQFFGAKRLTAFLVSMADQLASSKTPESSPGDSSPES